MLDLNRLAYIYFTGLLLFQDETVNYELGYKNQNSKKMCQV